ncbi:hypothetical protein [Spirosoma aerophilum]
MTDHYIWFRFVHVVPLGDWHRYSVMIPVVETRGYFQIKTHVEACSISFN